MASIKSTLGELRTYIKTILIESYVVADEALGSNMYRVFELYSASSNQKTGKLIITPITTKQYGDAGVNGILKSMGLREKENFHNAGVIFVVDHEKQVIDLDTSKFLNYKGRRPHPTANKSYVIPHADIAGENIVSFKKALIAILKHDKRIDRSYLIVGNPRYKNMTITDVLKQQNPGDLIAKGGQFQPMTFYHGTSEKRWKVIQKEGLKPNRAPKIYVDLVAGYSEFNVYLTTSVSVAENYATRAARDDNSKAVVVEVIVRKPNFVFDEDGANWITIPAPGPPWTKREKGEDLEMHFRHAYNHDGTSWQKWPNADQIWATYQKKLIKNLHNKNTIAYKGTIPAKDISLLSTYKPAVMSKDPSDQEFDDAKAKTLATYQRHKTSQQTDSRVKQVKSEPISGEKQYKIYPGGKGNPPVTRHHGKLYTATQSTKFKSGDKANVKPEDDKLRVKSISSDHSQLWNPKDDV